MMMIWKVSVATLRLHSLGRIFLALTALTAAAQTAQSPSQYQQLAHDIFKGLVEIKSTESGVGSTPAAEAVARGCSRRLLLPTYRSLGQRAQKNLVARLHGRYW
jgi:hypothetical protein